METEKYITFSPEEDQDWPPFESFVDDSLIEEIDNCDEFIQMPRHCVEHLGVYYGFSDEVVRLFRQVKQQLAKAAKWSIDQFREIFSAFDVMLKTCSPTRAGPPQPIGTPIFSLFLPQSLIHSFTDQTCKIFQLRFEIFFKPNRSEPSLKRSVVTLFNQNDFFAPTHYRVGSLHGQAAFIPNTYLPN